ncbi:hypothetical protein EBB07_06365 [Paenibacillaceae bacterium]|nr:hypothetical protein EBB07_06365 [Paenibacillaceae bacterium]
MVVQTGVEAGSNSNGLVGSATKGAMWNSNADERRYLGKFSPIIILRKLSHLIYRKSHDFSRK